MKRLNQGIYILLTQVMVSSLVYAYTERLLHRGENPEETVEYMNVSPDEAPMRSAVDLTPPERYALQRAIKKHMLSDNDYKRRIDEEFITLVLSGCGGSETNYCEVIEKVLRDYMNRNVDALFTGVGLSRDI